MYSDRKQINHYPVTVTAWGRGRRDYKGTRKLLEMTDMFIIWIVVMVSWVIRSYA